MENPAPVPLLLEVLLPVLLLGKFPVLLLKKMGIQQLHQQLGITCLLYTSAIVSMFLGDELTAILQAIENDT